MRIGLALVVACFACVSLVACQRGPVGRMKGGYVGLNGNATLEIANDTITVSGGPLNIAASYKIISIAGDVVTIEVSAANTPPGRLAVNVAPDSVDIKDNFLFGGRWSRK